MPHHGYADEWFWEDLPETAKKAASIMGYDEATWDAAEKVSYHAKDFSDLSSDEKRAAVYLGRNPLDYKLKSVKWATIDDNDLKNYATIMGWTEETWNRNFPLHDVPVDKLYWREMSDEQKEAAQFFGYNENLWDETGNEEVFDGSAPSEPAAAKPNKFTSTKPSSGTAAEEKKDDDVSDDDDSDDGDDEEKKKQKKKKKAKFSKTPVFGGENGDDFDHGNHMRIDQIVVSADGNHVHGIAVTYKGQEIKSGNVGRDAQTFKLRPGEFITSAKVTTGGGGLGLIRKPHVTSITFNTNRGSKLGPCGEEKGDEQVVKAPPGTVLCGLYGRAGRHINAIGFKWGPNPKA